MYVVKDLASQCMVQFASANAYFESNAGQVTPVWCTTAKTFLTNIGAKPNIGKIRLHYGKVLSEMRRETLRLGRGAM